MAGRFTRVETRRRARGFLLGLLAERPRKNCWTIAEHAGEKDPHGMQHFLAQASWDTDGVRDDLRDYVVGAFGGSDGVLVIDETGDVKKGRHTVGVQRPYTGTAGWIANAQVAVYLSDLRWPARARDGRPRALLPKSWTTDPDRCAGEGVDQLLIRRIWAASTGQQYDPGRRELGATAPASRLIELSGG